MYNVYLSNTYNTVVHLSRRWPCLVLVSSGSPWCIPRVFSVVTPGVQADGWRPRRVVAHPPNHSSPYLIYINLTLDLQTCSLPRLWTYTNSRLTDQYGLRMVCHFSCYISFRDYTENAFSGSETEAKDTSVPNNIEISWLVWLFLKVFTSVCTFYS